MEIAAEGANQYYTHYGLGKYHVIGFHLAVFLHPKMIVFAIVLGTY